MFLFDPVHRTASLEKGEGLADDIFKPLGQIRGDIGIAHTRYKTYGSGGAVNAQPFFDPFTGIALAHNGHVTNVPQITRELQGRGQALANHCDAEPLLRVLGLWFERFHGEDPGGREQDHMFRAISEVQKRVTGHSPQSR